MPFRKPLRVKHGHCWLRNKSDLGTKHKENEEEEEEDEKGEGKDKKETENKQEKGKEEM